MRKRWLLLVVGLVAGLGLGGAVLFLTRGSPITPQNVARIRVGMTQPEVEDILRGPPGNAPPGIGVPAGYLPVKDVSGKPTGDTQGTWVGDEYAVEVLFDGQGRVRSRAVQHLPKDYRPTFERRLRRLLPW